MPAFPPAPGAERLSVCIKMNLPRRLLIGLSGGADSVAMAWLLLQKRPELELRAVHVNHGLRGEASDADEAFVRQLCEKWRLPLDVYRAQPPENPGEDWARQVRYGFYRDAMEKHGAEAIALAHHRDDQAETMLLHLLRGTGLTGLAGMAQDSEVLGVRVIRPVLDCSRQQLREVLREAGLSWREDASNQDTHYLRNALRHELLPLMERLAPGASQRMAATAAILREDESVLDHLARQALGEATSYLPIATLEGLHPGLRQRVLRLWWQRYMGASTEERTLSRQQTEALAALIDAPAGSKCNLPGVCHGYRGWTHLHLRGRGSPSIQVALDVSGAAREPGNGRTCQAMPKALLEECQLRAWQPGDWISPFGQCGRQSLQDYFTNRKVDAPFREAVPLLCRGSEVLLAAGVGAGNIPAFDSTEENVMLRWMGDMPWMKK